MGALMKYWNDPATLAKIGERMGPVEAGAGPASAAPAAQAQAAPAASMPEINNLLDAAKCAPWILVHACHLLLRCCSVMLKLVPVHGCCSLLDVTCLQAWRS